MTVHPRTSASIGGLLLVLVASTGCAEDEPTVTTCSVLPTVTFDSRQYSPADTLQGVRRSDITVGKRLGEGTAPSCLAPSSEGVQVFKVVGTPATDGIFVEPDSVFGLMERTGPPQQQPQ